MGNYSSKYAHPVSVPPAPNVLLEHRRRFRELTPMPSGRDAPIASVYRMYSAIVCGEYDALREDFEYFWNHADWKVAKIANPNDRTPERYAFLAIVPYLLVESFNKRIQAGQHRGRRKSKELESVPKWCEGVPSLSTPLEIPDAEGNPPPDRNDEGIDKFMLKKNIIMKTIPVFAD